MTVYRWGRYTVSQKTYDLGYKVVKIDEFEPPKWGDYALTDERTTARFEGSGFVTSWESYEGKSDYFNGDDMGRTNYFYIKGSSFSSNMRVTYEALLDPESNWAAAHSLPGFMIQSPGKYKYSVSGKGIVTVYEAYHDSVTSPSKGSKIDTVTSSNRNAYPNSGEQGGYWYVYEGIANQEPTISGKDEDLGGFKAPFKKVFSVDDPDNNETLNVTVKLNSATIRAINNATKGESYEIDIDKTKFDDLELNKTNTIEITVSDSNGASAIRRYTFKKVNSNPLVTVTNSNLGEQNKPFNFSFKANDPDGDDITVKVYVDDVQVQDLGKVTPDQVKTIGIGKLDYAKLKNGEHRIKIEATDSFGAKGTGYITFTKKIDYCWYRLTKEVDAQPSAVVVNPLAELAKGAKMTVKVSLNAKDTNPTWEVLPDEFIGQKYNFKTKTKTADKWCIGVDIRIDRANTPEGMDSYFYGFVGAYM